MAIKVSTRLQKLADCCPVSKVAADVGCDHGKLSALLIEMGKAERMIATDISEPSLKKAERLADESGMQIETRLGDGLKPLLNGEAETVVIAGMGAMQIIDILSADREKTDSFAHFLLCPHTYPERLREYLNTNGFIIEREDILFEEDEQKTQKNRKNDKDALPGGHYYPIFLVKKGEETAYEKDELLFGRWWKTHFDPTYQMFLEGRLAHLNSIIEKAPAPINEIEEQKAICEAFYKHFLKLEETR
ncbi:MAG: SAM-dependent methyltransferase [Christensenellaceae bacterium]|nr:SAM-dependent methyltransferase [Christensenellaceae bacterium]